MTTPATIQNPIFYRSPFQPSHNRDENPQYHLSKSDAIILKKQQERNILTKIERIVKLVRPIHELGSESEADNDTMEFVEEFQKM